MQKLTFLDLGGTKITDAGLKEVAKLHQLTLLYLRDTKITDAGLKDVAKMKQLEWLALYDTKVTKAGVAELKKALPKCAIPARNRPHSSPSNSRSALAILMHVQKTHASVLEQAWREA